MLAQVLDVIKVPVIAAGGVGIVRPQSEHEIFAFEVQTPKRIETLNLECPNLEHL
jgi:hypothetical protein